MDAEQIKSLVKRVERAGGPDRDLDASIAPLQGPCVVDEGHPIGRMCYDDIGSAQLLPRFTASIDAALMLVPENERWSVRRGERFTTATVGDVVKDGANPALAICSAALTLKIMLDAAAQ